MVVVAPLALVAPASALSASLEAADKGNAANVVSPTKNTVKYWNEVLLEAIRRQGGGPGPISRAAAMMHAGMFDAINSATLSKRGSTPYSSYLTLRAVHQSVNENLAAAYTARDLLIEAMPQQRGYVEQKFTERYGNSYQAAARELADVVVNGMKAARAGDRADDPTGYTPENVPGAWRPTDGCTAMGPVWGEVTPFTMSSQGQFDRTPPAASFPDLLAGSAYADQLAEVRSLGGKDSAARTAEQTQIAWFWANDLDGTYKPPGQLLTHTAIVAEKRLNDGLQYSRLFALVSLAMADAGIAAWDMKYSSWFDLWRPETAIQQDPVSPDPTWEPLSADRNGVSFTPCFPSWVSGHATFAAAWAGIMRSEFGDDVTFTASTEDPHAVGMVRTFHSFSEAAAENARSRIYLGVHYRWDAEDGSATGYDIADHIFRNYLRARS
jgi:PAP2 superfamily